MDPSRSRSRSPALDERSSLIDSIACAFCSRLQRALQTTSLFPCSRAQRMDPHTDQAQQPIRSAPPPVTAPVSSNPWSRLNRPDRDRSTVNPFGPNVPNPAVVLHTVPLPTDQLLLPTGRSSRSSTSESVKFTSEDTIRRSLITKTTTICVKYKAPNGSRFWHIITKTTVNDKQVHLTNNSLTPVID